ncbi:hypothetical protein C8A03DRAFT_37608 [Achaetomium macrosporum]|uniref:RING-type domain-containing protein n=1 Tax=Achaetomium macrosporum TaxID=79813 RepID=A0AAN7C3F7_9PEZI|nr:hypothetical protein C8A03DRAFT_37608 [Achaetomium macrosporum]
MAQQHQSQVDRPEEDRPEASLWQDIRNYLEHKDDTDKPRPQPPVAICPICRIREFDILGIPRSSPDAMLAQGAVLVCGHMACSDCIGDWYSQCKTDRRPITCPMCRLNLKFDAPDCEHYSAPFFIPQAHEVSRHDFLQRMFPTISEGGTKPPRCNRCRSKNAEQVAAHLGGAIDQQRGEMVNSGQFTQPEVAFIHAANFRDLIIRYITHTSDSTWGAGQNV